MSIPVRFVPLLRGRVGVAFVRVAEGRIRRRGSVDFSDKVSVMRKILAKSCVGVSDGRFKTLE